MSGSWPSHHESGASGRTPDGLEQRFDATNLVSLRSAVAAHGSALGLPASRVHDLVLVAHELASNAVRHGGGSGRLRVWRLDGSVYCEVADAGGGFLFSNPERRPDVNATGGRGLWIIARLADDVRVESGEQGTVTLVELRLPHPD
jgi:anti-sigma regulatory factor (Ser/Thr protein kinase)